MLSEVSRQYRLTIGRTMDVVAAFCLIASLFLPHGSRLLYDIEIHHNLPAMAALIVGTMILLMNAMLSKPRLLWGLPMAALGFLLGAVNLKTTLSGVVLGTEATGFWLVTIAMSIVVFRSFQLLTWPDDRLMEFRNALCGVIFGLWLLFMWHVLSEGFYWPRQVAPSIADVAGILDHFGTLAREDFKASFIHSFLVGWAGGIALGIILGSVIAMLVSNLSVLEERVGTYDWIIWALMAPVLVMLLGNFERLSGILSACLLALFPISQAVIQGWKEQRSPDMSDFMKSLGQSENRLRLTERFMLFVTPRMLKAATKSVAPAGGAVLFCEFFYQPVSVVEDKGSGLRMYGELSLMNTDFAVMSLIAFVLGIALLRGIIANIAGWYFYLVFGQERP